MTVVNQWWKHQWTQREQMFTQEYLAQSDGSRWLALEIQLPFHLALLTVKNCRTWLSKIGKQSLKQYELVINCLPKGWFTLRCESAATCYKKIHCKEVEIFPIISSQSSPMWPSLKPATGKSRKILLFLCHHFETRQIKLCSLIKHETRLGD